MSTTLVEWLEMGDEGPIVDCDLHVYPPDESRLIEHLPERFRGKGVSYPDGNWASPVESVRDDAVPEDGPAGSDPALTRERHLDALGIDHAILTGGGPNLRATVIPDRRYAAALTSAYNDWLVDTWLSADERFHGSISVAATAPRAAAEEIRRLGDHPDMVQVLMGSATQIALGKRRYWPIYEAAVEHDLPVAIHIGSEGYGVANPNTGGGYPNTYVERQTVAPANFMGQLLNLVLEGPFVEFPELRVVLIGSGYSWVPSFLWRLDKNWKGLSDDIPWIERPPSQYVEDRVRFVTYPIDEADDPNDTSRMLEMMNAERTLMFGSNFPHAGSYAPGDDLPALDSELARAIFSDTATAWYSL